MVGVLSSSLLPSFLPLSLHRCLSLSVSLCRSLALHSCAFVTERVCAYTYVCSYEIAMGTGHSTWHQRKLRSSLLAMPAPPHSPPQWRLPPLDRPNLLPKPLRDHGLFLVRSPAPFEREKRE